MNKQSLIITLFFVCAGAFGQDHEPMPLMIPPDNTSRDAVPAPDRRATIAAFNAAYLRAGEPSIAIFWNRAFDDQLSQWEADYRRSITGEASARGNEIFEQQGGEGGKNDSLGSAVQSLSTIQPSGEALGSYEKNVSGGSRILASEYHESRRQQGRVGLSEATEFEFSSGFLRPFLENQVKVLDRQAIMRLVERDSAKEAGSEMIADYQKIETDALVGYADYVGEILFSPDSTSDLGMNFLISVKEVGTGRVVAKFRSSSKVPQNKRVKVPRYVATSNGFAIAEQPISAIPPLHMGEQLAHETMQALTRVWKNY
jgi:hypothetical protein